MIHQHFDDIESTSTYLKSQYKEIAKDTTDERNILVSCRKQTGGRGRSGNSWEQPDNSLAFSFIMKPSEEMTLSSLELGILLSEYLGKKIFLKWPNDLLNGDNEKVGGILCQLVENSILIVGIGLNFGEFEKSKYNFPYPIGCVDEEKTLSEEDYENIPKEIYQYILDNRLTTEQIVSKWNSLCIHLNKKVEIRDHDHQDSGIFKGINDQGAALIENSHGDIKPIMSGSLFILE